MANKGMMILERVDGATRYLQDKVLNLRINFAKGHLKL
jgi:hypothetical protein